MKSRYCFNPSVSRQIGHRLTVAERFRRWRYLRELHRNAPDLFLVTGFCQPIYPKK